jgi:hypothetical protein
MNWIRNASRIFVGKSEENRPFGRSRPGWEGSVKVDVQGIEYKDVIDSFGSGLNLGVVKLTTLQVTKLPL